MLAVKVHSGSGYVRGAARRWPYFIASLFEVEERPDGRLVWRNTGEHVGPFRSVAKTTRLGKELAFKVGADFIEGYGSLHNLEIRPVSPVAVSV